VSATSDFEQLVAEAESASVDGWDFSWFDGRATEERPSWGYSRILAERMAAAHAALDIQTGGGEVLRGIPQPPKVLVATESWPPNLALARENLRPLGGTVIEVADDAALPFADETFDLVVSRHPTTNPWAEIARVLEPGGTYLSQQVGSGTNRELFEYLMGPQPINPISDVARLTEGVRAHGLEVLDARQESLRIEFFDIGAVVHFLRKVIWTVPDFTVDRYRERLLAMHEHIQMHGVFVSYSRRALIEARKP
jgi:SAM-dependent methyltransferase